MIRTVWPVDASGNLYIADEGNNRIRKVSPSGIIATVAGNGTGGFFGDNGPATSAELHGPNGVAVDASGNLYIADYGQQSNPQGEPERHHHHSGRVWELPVFPGTTAPRPVLSWLSPAVVALDAFRQPLHRGYLTTIESAR